MRAGSRAGVLVLFAVLLPLDARAASVEERLERLEREQAELKRQLEEKDRKIRDLELHVSDQAAAAAAAAPQTQTTVSPRQIEAEAIAAEQETWGSLEPGKGFKVAQTEY